MGGTPTNRAPGQGVPESAGAKITAAFELLVSAFADTRTDSEVLGKDDLLEQIAASQHVLNVAWGVQAARLAQAAAIEEVRFPDHTAPLGFRDHAVAHPIGTHQDEFIGCEIGPLLGWTSGQAVDRVSEAADFLTRTPRLFARVGTGEIDPAKLATVHRAIGRTVKEFGDHGQPVTIDLARAVETALLGGVDPGDDTAEATGIVQAHVDLISRQSTGRLQRRTQRILHTLDPVSAGNAATKRRRDRVGVFAHPDDEPGLTHLHAILDSATAAQLMTAVDQLARDLHQDSTGKTLAECKADALADLVLGNATVTTNLIIQVPVHADSGSCSPSRGGTTSTSSSAADDADTSSAADDAGAAATDSHGGRGPACWPAAFAHPITGLTVFPSGQSAAATGAGTVGGRTTATGVQVKSQHDLDVEFNELMKTLWPPDPEDYPPDVFDDYHEPGDRDHGDGPPAWWREPAWPPGLPDGRDGHGTSPGSAAADVSAAHATAWLGDAFVPGIGAIPAAAIQELSRSFGTTITRALIDADTGVTVETSETRYRPSRRLADFIRTRDVHCRFPNCDRPARWCDIDHVTPWPAGPTAASNLQLLCRHHHRTKQEQHWTVTMTRDGVCTWISPTGRTHTTHPGE